MGLIRDLPYLLAVGAIAFVFFAATEPNFLPAAAVLVPQALQMIGLQFMIPDSPMARHSPTRIPLADGQHYFRVTHHSSLEDVADDNADGQQPNDQQKIARLTENLIATDSAFETFLLAYGDNEAACRGGACPVCHEFIDMDPGRRRDVEMQLIGTGGPSSLKASRELLTARSRAFKARLDSEQISDIFPATSV